MADVELKNITKIYDGSNEAVKDISIKIEDKEFVVLVGPSGCGKSTTLRMIAGLEDITSGDIYISGKRVNDVSPKNRDIAMVFQNYALYPHMTVFENMAFGLKLRKIPKAEVKDRVLKAARILDLESYLERKPKALSGGQRQRVAVGRAIVRKPAVFLFDEPLSNLDAKLRVQTRTEISKLHSKLNATMIYVTHDQTEAMTMADQIVLMKDGVIQQIDEPLNLYNFPSNKFVAGFIGSPAMNFFVGAISITSGSFISESTKLRILLSDRQRSALKNYDGKKVFAGIRPEDIHDVINGKGLTNSTEINVNLDVVEPTGNEILLYFNFEDQPFVSRIPAREIPDLTSEKKLYIDSNKLHFFDPSSEIVITQ
jgi:multiple sugar transport system ATP-binding protein